MSATVDPDAGFYADLVKFDDHPDGSVTVYAIPAKPSTLDHDGQGVDPDWLKAALTKWFPVGNVREMHQLSAVGTAKKLDFDGDMPYTTAHVVDDQAVKKVKAGVYKGMSVGIKKAVTKRDKRFPKGLICGGDIIEVSLVDRPCIPGSDILDVKADLFKIASVVSQDEILDWQSGIVMKIAGALFADEPLVEKRDMDRHVGGGVDRDKIPAEDFAGKNRSFPIVTPGDVSDAASSIGRAGSDNYSSDQLKRNIIRIAERKGAAFVAELPEAWKTDKEKTTVADTDDINKTAEATEPPVEQEAVEKTAEADETKTWLVAEIEKRAASTVFCSECGTGKELLDGVEKTVGYAAVLEGHCEHGHVLRKAVGAAEVTKADEGAGDDVEKADTADAAETEKTADAETVKADSQGAGDGHDGDHEDTAADGSDAGDTDSCDMTGGDKTTAPELSKQQEIEVAKTAFVSLLSDLGIDPSLLTKRIADNRVEKMNALLDEARDLTDQIGKADAGGPTHVTGIADQVNRLSSVTAEINELASLMHPGDGKFRTDRDTEGGKVDLGAAHVATPSEHIDLQQEKTLRGDLEKAHTGDAGKADVEMLAKVAGAELAKTLAPIAGALEGLAGRLETVEHGLRPAFQPVEVPERPNAFTAKAAAEKNIRDAEITKALEGLSDDQRVKLLASILGPR